MSPRRQETSLSEAQPVRFYKLVALSFLCLTLILLGVIAFMSSKRAVITVTTKKDPIDVQAVVTVGGNGLYTVTGIVTSTTVTVEETFSPTGSKSEPGVAGGIVTLHNDSDQAQPLIATTRLMTPDGKIFRLKDRITVPARGNIEASVYADEKGEAGNIGPVERFTIPGLNDARQKQVYASSKDSMTGGVITVGVLSMADVEKAKKQLLQTLENKGKLMLKEMVQSEDPAIYSVVQHVVEGEPEVGKETGSFTLMGKASVLGVFYNKDQVNEAADAALNKHAIDDIGIIRTSNEEPTVALGNYDIQKNTAELTVYHSGIVTLNPESKQLQKMLFFGKTKEEVRRDLLSLDHVYGVEVTFRPPWVRTIPYVPDHVQIVVKEVE